MKFLALVLLIKQYNTDKEKKKKLTVVDRKTPDTTGLVKTNCYIKNIENENKIHDTSC